MIFSDIHPHTKALKKSILLYFVLFVMPIQSYAQDSDDQSNATPKFQVGMAFSPDYCYRTLKTDDQNVAFIIDIRNESEIPKFGYTTGLSFIYNFNRVLGLESGIHYSNKGYALDETQIIIYPSSGDLSSFEAFYSFNRLDIPVKLNLSVGKKRGRFIAGLGVVSHFSLSETSKTIIHYSDGSKETKKQESQYDYTLFNLSPVVSAGVDLRINEHLNLRLEPTFKYNILTIIEAPIRGYLWNAGFNTSLFYKI